MESVKTIDAIYSEVKDFDIVLCNDAPLATALNNRVDVAKIGIFAITPRQLASTIAVERTGKGIIGDIELVKKISDDTGYSIRFVHGEVENIKRIRRYTAEVDKYMGRRSRNVYSAFRQYNTKERIMEEFDGLNDPFFEHKKVAVVGLDLFDDLDKHMVPSQYEDVDITDYGNEYSIKSMRALGNNRLLADAAADIVMRSKPTDVAIVIDTKGAIADAVRSSLYRNHISFINTLSVRDLNSIRNYLEFLNLALSFDTIEVNDVRSLFSSFGGYIKPSFGKHNFAAFFKSGAIADDSRAYALMKCMSDVRDLTFEEVCSTCMPADERASVRLLNSQMECANQKVTRDLVDDLVYAVNSIGNLTHNEQIPQSEKEGVLLVDCNNSVFVDRPVVVYLGLGEEWNPDMKGLDFLSTGQKQDLREKNVQRFKALVQQGSLRYYFVNSQKGGKESVPCDMFDELSGMDEVITSFDMVCDEILVGPWEFQSVDRGVTSDMTFLEDSSQSPKMFSSSTFREFFMCPRMYEYGRLVESTDVSATFTGEKIHQYAQFHLSYPNIVKSNGPDFFTDKIADLCASLNSPERQNVERSNIRTSICEIDEFLESIGVCQTEMKPYGSDRQKNMFLDLFGLTEVSANTERSFQSSSADMEGRMDLVWKGRIYDFKTGKEKDFDDIIKAMSFDRNKQGFRDFQAMFYLSLIEDSGEENDNEFVLFFTRGNSDNAVNGRPMDLQACIRRVRVVEDIFEFMKEEHSDYLMSTKAYAKYDFGWLVDTCREYDDPINWHNNGELVGRVYQKIGNKANAEKVVKKIGKFFAKPTPQYEDTILIPRSTMDEFREIVRNSMADLKEYYNTSFPMIPVIDCKDCYFKDMCTKELTDGGEEDVAE